MNISYKVLFGTIESVWIDNNDDCVVLIHDNSGFRHSEVGRSLPNKYQITMSKEFVDEYRTPNVIKPSFDDAKDLSAWKHKISTGVVIAFAIRIGYYPDFRCSGFIVENIISYDLERDINEFFNDILETKSAGSTDLPLFEYREYKSKVVKGCFGYTPEHLDRKFYRHDDVEYQVEALRNIPTQNTTMTCPDSEDHLLVYLRDSSNEHLTLHNLGLIFDKFYRPVRGLGFNYEYRYGEAITYYVSKCGDIIHKCCIDKVKYTADRSSDRSSRNDTVVLRLGDRLSEEMIEFLKEPVKGHYKPNVLFQTVCNLAEKDLIFMRENMSIDTDWLQSEINSLYYNKEVVNYIRDLVSSAKRNDPQNIKILFPLADPDRDTKDYEVFDSLRHAFTSFVSGGLHDLYIYQSNESWYPKILLSRELQPNDISMLPEIITIYRGCSISEFSDKKYGQAWTTSSTIAEEFAYQHYSSQLWYDPSTRCVLKARIRREDVYFSRQDHPEREVVINSEKIMNVQKS